MGFREVFERVSAPAEVRVQAEGRACARYSLRARSGLQNGLAKRNAEGGDNGPAGAHEIGAGAICSHAAAAYARVFDHAKTGMTLLRQFDRGVGEIAAAFVPGDKNCGPVHETVELTTWVPRVLGLDFGPDFVRLSPFVIQILDYKLVLRIEVAVKRHLAGARGLSDRFDAHASNAPAVEEVLRAIEDSVARLPGPGNLYLRIRA